MPGETGKWRSGLLLANDAFADRKAIRRVAAFEPISPSGARPELCRSRGKPGYFPLSRGEVYGKAIDYMCIFTNATQSDTSAARQCVVDLKSPSLRLRVNVSRAGESLTVHRTVLS